MMNNTTDTITQGFTLLEMLIVVAIIGITLAIGVPSLKSTIADNRLTASANDMLAALQKARSESSKRVKFAGVSVTGNTWTVFVNSPSNVIHSDAAATNITLTVTGGSSQPTFRPEGRLNTNIAVTMTFTSTGSKAQRTLTIAPSGKVQITNP